MPKIYIGIDPGLNGAVAAIDENFHVLGLTDTPVIKTGGKLSYDVTEMANVLRRFALMGDAVVILEQAQGMPGQGIVSTFSIGFGFGIWSGILGALGISYRAIKPSVWVREILTGSPGQGKERSINFALKLFPTAELTPQGCRKPRDGRSDALALAYWGTKS
jgi:crossover junction endodeoxyribonuclease RuvC